MTITEFRKEYGKEFDKFKSKPLYVALMAVADAQSPRRLSVDRPIGDVVVAGGLLYMEIKGWEEFRDLLQKRLSAETDEEKEQDPDYSKPESI